MRATETRSSEGKSSYSQRPKSTPASRYHSSFSPSVLQTRRPKTASLLISNEQCERLAQVEREPVKQHRFKSHFPLRKDKPAPWQAKLEFESALCSPANQLYDYGPQKPIHIAPGYFLSRSKAKYQAVINEKLFEQAENRLDRKSSAESDPQVTKMIDTLKQQISDLSLHAEEERLQHIDTKRKAAELLQDKTDELKNDHKEAVRRLKDEYSDSMATTAASHQQELLELKESHEAVVAKYRTEIDLLQGAFQTFKTQSNAENHKRLKEQKAQLADKYAKDIQSKINEITMRLKNEHGTAITQVTKEHAKTLSDLEKQSKREMEALNRRYTNHAADIKKLKDVEEENMELEQKCEDLSSRCKACEKDLINAIRERDEHKAKLTAFEQEFETRVADVDRQYRSQLSDIMEQNTQLRKQYMKKCEELFALAAKTDQEKADQLETTKDVMKELIRSRVNAKVSVAAADPKIKKKTSKHRPCSAPSTSKEELKAAESAGEIDEFLAQKEVPFVRPHSVLEMSAAFELNDLTELTDNELTDGLKL